MDRGILNEEFPERFSEYAFAFARRFGSEVSHYTPLNEPQTAASLCGHRGVWPPYLQGIEGWARLCLPLARATVLSSRALRDAMDQPVLISADCTFTPSWREIAAAAGLPDLEPSAPCDLLLSFFPASLAYGKIDLDGPLAQCLSRIGFTGKDFEWFKDHAEAPDVFGFNFYPDPKAVRSGAAEEDLFDFLRRILLAFGLPLYITETSSGLDDLTKVQWIESIGRVFRKARAEGFPLVGVNWWPLYNTIQWDFRDNGKSVEECIVPGGWNNGLYVINTEALERVPPAAVEAYRDLAQMLLVKK
jgi:beta-glucosidase/6-phospho-beta-glucosidase/beta-galactosidase